LAAEGVEAAFCVPGESYLDVIDGIARQGAVRLVTCRHEAAAANMAVASGKLNGRPGVCLVSRGPGALHASIGVHIARQDSVPMVLLVGQVPRDAGGLEAFQELDYVRVFASVAKWAAQVDDPNRIVEMTSRAFGVATSGRPGPVVLALPEDVLALPSTEEPRPRATPVECGPGADVDLIASELAAAERPLLIVGSCGWSQPVADALRTWAEAARIPVVAAFRSQDSFDNESLSYVGALGVGAPRHVKAAVREADAILAIGTRLDEMTTGSYNLIPRARRAGRLLMTFPDADELVRVYTPDRAVVSTSAAFVAALAAVPLRPAPKRERWTSGLREQYTLSRQTLGAGPLDIGAVVSFVSDTSPPDTVVCNGAGIYTAWIHRFHQFRRHGTQLAPVAGAMGFGLPAAVAAKVLRPATPAVCYAGDGCFLMSGQELATAAAQRLNPVIIVVNNGSYGSIRAHQERRFPGSTDGTDLVNPDFVAYARSFGAGGALVRTTKEFCRAFPIALESSVPYLIEVRVDVSARPPA
jgi:acetolactate synthase I/II/III large subunit